MGGVNVIYSRLGEKADDLIKRLAEKTGEELVVVTSDRSIADYVSRRGGSAVPSHVFSDLLEKMDVLCPKNGNEKKDADEGASRRGKQKGPSRRPSKKERLSYSRIKKL
jgi:predicted RNA-binding protein with PIN domain